MQPLCHGRLWRWQWLHQRARDCAAAGCEREDSAKPAGEGERKVWRWEVCGTDQGCEGLRRLWINI